MFENTHIKVSVQEKYFHSILYYRVLNISHFFVSGLFLCRYFLPMISILHVARMNSMAEWIIFFIVTYKKNWWQILAPCERIALLTLNISQCVCVYDNNKYIYTASPQNILMLLLNTVKHSGWFKKIQWDKSRKSSFLGLLYVLYNTKAQFLENFINKPQKLYWANLL